MPKQWKNSFFRAVYVFFFFSSLTLRTFPSKEVMLLQSQFIGGRTGHWGFFNFSFLLFLVSYSASNLRLIFKTTCLLYIDAVSPRPQGSNHVYLPLAINVAVTPRHRIVILNISCLSKVYLEAETGLNCLCISLDLTPLSCAGSLSVHTICPVVKKYGESRTFLHTHTGITEMFTKGGLLLGIAPKVSSANASSKWPSASFCCC